MCSMLDSKPFHRLPKFLGRKKGEHIINHPTKIVGVVSMNLIFALTHTQQCSCTLPGGKILITITPKHFFAGSKILTTFECIMTNLIKD